MRIVYLVHDMSHIAGGTRVIAEHVNGLARLGHQAEIWVNLPERGSYFNVTAPIRALADNDVTNPDVVIATDQSFLPMLAASRKKKRTILLLQHDDAWLAATTQNRPYVDLIAAHKAYFETGQWHIFTVSAWLTDTIQQRYGIPCTTVPNGVDTKTFRRSSPILRLSGPSVLLYADLQLWKGFELAATVAMEAKKQIPLLNIILLGAFLPNAVNPDGTGNRFAFPTTFFCAPEQHDLRRIYSSATVFLSASWQEGFGMPGLEAMACGTPLVTTDNGGSREYARHAENAIVVPTMHTQALIDGLLLALSNAALRERLAKNGRETAKSMDWKRQIKQLHDRLTNY